MMIIDTANRIALDGKGVGIVGQTPTRTRVIDLDGYEIALPCERYSLAAENPTSGNPGRSDFERHLRAAIGERQ